MSEVSDTTQTSGAAVVEMDREALSVAEQHQDSGRRASHEVLSSFIVIKTVLF